MPGIPAGTDSVPFAGSGFTEFFVLVAVVFAVALGFRQSAWESGRGTYLFLLHRPAARDTIFLTKLATGAGVLVLCSTLPVVLYGWWAAVPGHHPSPFDWSMTEYAWRLVFQMPLLYLGAFMIVVSAAVLVVVYWHAFPLPLQLAFAAAVPLTFYGGGFVLRARLHSPIAGGAFTSIASLLVAIDFAAVYQLGGLAGRVDANLYWLTSALICSAVYAVSAWRLRGEFYGYLFWLGGANALVAFTRAVQLPLEWSIGATGGLAALMLVSAAALHDVAAPWQELTRSTRRSARPRARSCGRRRCSARPTWS